MGPERQSARISRVSSLVVLLAVLLSGCGSRQAADHDPASYDISVLESQVLLPAHHMPRFPADRHSAALTEHTILGYAAELTSTGAQATGTALTLSSQLVGAEYALYRFNPGSLLQDSVHVLLDDDQTTGAYIGLANYVTQRWEFLGPYAAPKSLALDAQRYRSPLGNIWVAVLAARGQQASVAAVMLRTLNPANQLPQALLAASPLSGDLPLLVDFDASGSSDPDGSILDYAWDFDGNGTYEEFSDGPQVSHSYSTPGLRLVRVRVTDNDLARATATLQINVTPPGNASPIALCTPALIGAQVPLTVDFDATASFDPDGLITRYDWDFNGDGLWEGYDAGPQPSFVFSAPGNFNLGLRVTDNAGAQSLLALPVNLNVTGNVPPTAALLPAPTGGLAPLQVSFDASLSSDVDGTIVNYEWDFNGDGLFDAYGDAPSAEYSFILSGSYSTRLRVTDDSGAQDIASQTITVGDVTHAVLQASPSEAAPGTTVQLSAAGSSNPGSALAQFEWDLNGDGSYESDSGDSPFAQVLLPAIPGHLTVSVRVTAQSGAQATASRRLTAQGWANSPDPAAAGLFGTTTTVAIVAGHPAIAYRENNQLNLRYVRALDPEGSAWGPAVTVDSEGSNGQTPSLQVVNGYPAISYHYFTGRDLRYARALDATGSSWGTPLTLDSDGITGEMSCLLVVSGRPAIAYYKQSDGDLRYLRSNDSTGASWPVPQVIDDGAGADTGRWPKMEIVAGKPAIAYLNATASTLRYVRAGDASGSNWDAPLTVDSDAGSGNYPSLRVVNGRPAISYHSTALSALRYVRALDEVGGDWGQPLSIDIFGSFGWFTQLLVVEGRPAVAYINQPNFRLRCVLALDASGAVWDTAVPLDASLQANGPSILVLPDGKLGIAYSNHSNGQLRFMRQY